MNTYRDNKTLSLGKADVLPLYLYFLYGFYLIIESVRKWGIDQWTIFVSLPILVILLSIIISKFYYSKTTNENDLTSIRQ